jgi:hypothetical protein
MGGNVKETTVFLLFFCCENSVKKKIGWLEIETVDEQIMFLSSNSPVIYVNTDHFLLCVSICSLKCLRWCVFICTGQSKVMWLCEYEVPCL